MSRDGRVARDVMLGLLKTCQTLRLSFYHYLGDRLGIDNVGLALPPLPTIILAPAKIRSRFSSATPSTLTNGTATKSAPPTPSATESC